MKPTRFATDSLRDPESLADRTQEGHEDVLVT